MCSLNNIPSWVRIRSGGLFFLGWEAEKEGRGALNSVLFSIFFLGRNKSGVFSVPTLFVES